MQSIPASSSPERDQDPAQHPQQPNQLVDVVDTEKLFAGRTEIRVRHRGEEYRLRITRQGKLILTK